ncbi:pumilio homolog 12-like [Gastrolobium bilobum]|uniref:pumilio homolog 12-like n=1 Tax=Gastrolobium bilobum TaxID=150636 RepID=UPI002AAF34D0|nr:pumilio homolog 12-like [Gastrolobium bilobum]
MEASYQDLRSSATVSPSPEISDQAMYQNRSHSNPSIQKHLRMHCTSQNHPFDHNPITPNQENFLSPMNQNQSNITGSRWLNPTPVETARPGMEHLASSMERLCLSNPYNSYTAGYDFGGNNTSQHFLHGVKYSGFSTLSHHDHLRGTINPRLSNNGIRLGCHGYYGLNDQRHSLSSLEDVRDQRGFHFLMNKFNEGNPQIIEMLLWEVKDHLYELMMDHQSNYIIQNIFEACTVDQMTRILAMVIRNEQRLKEVCIHSTGTRAIQKLLQHLKTPEQISTAIFALKRITLKLTKSINGGFVIQECLKLFSPALTKFILNEVAKNCVEIATDKSGSPILQKCLDHAKGDAMRQVIEEIVSYAPVLTDHRYGNYAVQYVVKMKIPQVNAAIISQLVGKYVQLSMNKHASNVVEDLLEFSEESDAAIIVHEIMYNRNFLGILQHPYGNYVAQKALKNSKGALNKMLLNSILSNYTYLHNHPYGKRVLALVK